MLVLTRRIGESLKIVTPDRHEINITLTNLNGRQAKIGIDAPAYYVVQREEVVKNRDGA